MSRRHCASDGSGEADGIVTARSQNDDSQQVEVDEVNVGRESSARFFLF